MVTPTRCESEHRQRRMLVTCGRECVSAKDIQIGDVVSLTIRVQNAFFSIGTHASGAYFVNSASQLPFRWSSVRLSTGLAWFALPGCAPAGIGIGHGAIGRSIGGTGRTREAGRTTRAHAGHDFASCPSEQFLGLLLEVRDQCVVVVRVSEVNLQNTGMPQ